MLTKKCFCLNMTGFFSMSIILKCLSAAKWQEFVSKMSLGETVGLSASLQGCSPRLKSGLTFSAINAINANKNYTEYS